MKDFDTIAAIATGLTESGISIIRISGDKALNIVKNIFRGKVRNCLDNIKTYTMHYGCIVDDKDEILDEVIVSYMKAPKSYTCEDVVEINCHGGIVTVNKVLDEVIKNGARLAEPGEFTKRAFLNGRIDLSQAEAVIDIIRAKTDLSAKAAVMQSEGVISKAIKKLNDKLIEILAHIDAAVDFPEDNVEDITSSDIVKNLNGIISEIDKLLDTSDEGKILRDGISVAIVGRPNVGKSSLLNLLLREKRAIVTEVPGTTRDVIEEYINLNGIPVKIIDTAGIRETEDVIEKIGVERSIKKIDEADLIILMLDSSSELTDEDVKIIGYVKDKNFIIVLNKIDLPLKISISSIKNVIEYSPVKISTKTGSGIDTLKKTIKDIFFSGNVAIKDPIVTNSRHKNALIKAKKSCLDAINTLKATDAIDLASIDIKNAWSSLGEITGETLDEDIIDKIFSKFCIGK